MIKDLKAKQTALYMQGRLFLPEPFRTFLLYGGKFLKIKVIRVIINKEKNYTPIMPEQGKRPCGRAG